MLNNEEQKGGKFSLASLLIVLLTAFGIIGNVACSNNPERSLPIVEPTLPATAQSSSESTTESINAITITHSDGPRGYQTTPQELHEIARKAADDVEPYATAVSRTLEEADKQWTYSYSKEETCPDAHSPAWNDNNEGTSVLFAKALAYHLTGEERYASEVKGILQAIMTEVKTISLTDEQCQLNFAWGAPELVSVADLIEDYWRGMECHGPISTEYENTTLGSGQCKALFQNWLVKNPYYVVSVTAESSTNNWGAAATNTTAHIADYLWDRPQVELLHRNPEQINDGQDSIFTPAQAYAHANQIALDRMNGYRVQYGNARACDLLDDSPEQSEAWPFVKSQITDQGILPDDARRTEYCNILTYSDEEDHNYPQLHLGNNIQQCELMLRRGDSSCFDNIDESDIPDYIYVDSDGAIRKTHLYPGRGSIVRGINAIIDAGVSWQHDPALEVAYRYYSYKNSPEDYASWYEQLNRRRARCLNHICFGVLTHGFAEDEIPDLPPSVMPPKDTLLGSN